MASQSLKRCPDCGEAYAPSYKRCPFCEEEAALQEGEYIRRSSRSRSRRRHSSSFSLVTPTLIILILLMSGLLVYLLFGDQITAKLKGEELPAEPPASSSEVVEPPASSGIEPVAPDPSGSSTEAPPPPPVEVEPTVIPYDTINALPTALTLNKSDFTLPVGDPDVQLKVSGGSGTYTWVSQDPNVATVDETGKVKAIARGTVNILASDGSRKGVCIVRVKGGSAPATTTPTTPSTGTSTNLSLNKTDYTTHVGEMDVLLTLGVTDGIVWETSNASVATVNKGLVHAVGKGTCTVTATYNGNSYKCIVRVTG